MGLVAMYPKREEMLVRLGYSQDYSITCDVYFCLFLDMEVGFFWEVRGELGVMYCYIARINI